MTDQELRDLIGRLAISQEKTDAQLAKTDAQLAKTDAQLAKTDKKLDKIAKLIGGISNNIGSVTEKLFYDYLKNNNHLGDIYFDDITANPHKYRSNVEEEFDIVLTNGNSAAVVEVKYKAVPNDLKKLERKLKNFKLLYPEYKDYTLYGAIAGAEIVNDAKEEAKDKGFFILEQKGDVIETTNTNVKPYK